MTDPQAGADALRHPREPSSPGGYEYVCHSCGYTQQADSPPEFCPHCHAETHAESS